MKEGFLHTETGRRRLLSASVLGMIAAPLAVQYEYEYETGKNGIKTPYGTFMPIYEHHGVGIKPEAIRPSMDIVFREIVFNDPSEPPEELLLKRGEGNDGLVTMDVFPKPILSRLAKQNSEIMIGDVFPDLNTFKKYLYGEMLTGVPALVYGLHRTSKRRQVLKNLGVGYGAWSISVPITHNAAYHINKHQATPDRLSARIAGLTTHLHPELDLHLFRNLVMSLKLITAAQEYKERNNRKPEIGFWVNSTHSSIEDMLRLGPDTLRKLILLHPKFFLKAAVERNGGVELFTSSRLFRLPENLPPDFGKNELAATTTRTLLDEQLVEGLRRRLG